MDTSPNLGGSGGGGRRGGDTKYGLEKQTIL